MINGHKLIQIKQTFSSPAVGNISERIKNEIDNLKQDKVIKSGDSKAQVRFQAQMLEYQGYLCVI